jgi:hypothetical protein
LKLDLQLAVSLTKADFYWSYKRLSAVLGTSAAQQLLTFPWQIIGERATDESIQLESSTGY